MIKDNVIPDTWQYAPLEELLVYVIGGDWGTSHESTEKGYELAFCIRGSEFRNWENDKGNTASLRKIKNSSLNNRILQLNDILVEISGGGPEQPVGRTVLIGKTTLSFKPNIPKVPTNFLRLLRSSRLINSTYLDSYLKYFYRSGEILDYQGGSNNLRNLKFKNYVKITIPIPPLNEQHRIVDKIEELFSELDKGVECLKKARDQLKVYRQSLLKHAFEGKLTEQWRKDNADKLESAEDLLERIKQEREARYKKQVEEWKAALKRWEKGGRKGKKPGKPRQPKTFTPLEKNVVSKLITIPSNWCWEKLGWMTLGVEYGTAAKSNKEGICPVLRMGNIQNGNFEWDDLVYTSNKTEISQYQLKTGDVLFNRTNSPELVGKSAIYNGARPALFAGYLIRVNHMVDMIDSDYLNYYLNSHIAKGYGNSVKTDGVNQSNINGDKLMNYPFPYCSIEEQSMIVESLQVSFSVIDQNLFEIDENIIRSQSLRQSILKKAFSGQLVAQDPKDEPASILLERIAAEKAKMELETKKIKLSKVKTNKAGTKNDITRATKMLPNVIPFGKKVKGINTTNLHAGVLALAYEQYEKKPKLLNYFGHVKGEKLAHLVEAHLGIDLGRMPVKDAAGPNDYPHLKKVEHRAKMAGYFTVRRSGSRYVFHKSKKFPDIIDSTRQVLGDRLPEVGSLIEKLAPLNTQDAEIVATLYAAWNNLLLDGLLPSDDEIIYEARENWTPSKLKITRQKFRKGLVWLRKENLVPLGKGKKVVRKSKKSSVI